MREQAAPPDATAGLGGGGTCPECGHDTVGKVAPVIRFYLHLVGRKPRPVCPEWLSSVETGVGLPGECGCRDAFHW